MMSEKERPILFSGEMVRAILEGRKTQTRRIFDPQPIPVYSLSGGWRKEKGKFYVGPDMLPTGEDDGGLVIAYAESDAVLHVMGRQALVKNHSPYGQAGDLLYVKEGYQIKLGDQFLPNMGDDPAKRYGGWVEGEYSADESGFKADLTGKEFDRWQYRKFPYRKTPGRFMYRSLSRITLKITDIRVERLQDISEKDAAAEGIKTSTGSGMIEGETVYHFPDGKSYSRIASHAFQALWDSINGKGEYPWSANPWVWVVEFEMVTAGTAVSRLG